VGASGPSLSFFNRKKEQLPNSDEEWLETTRWVNLLETWALTCVAERLMQNLWTVARHRYLAADVSKEPIYLPVEDTPHSIRMSCPGPSMNRMSLTVAIRRSESVQVRRE